MMRYKTLDEQARDVYFDEGKKEGLKEGAENTAQEIFHNLINDGIPEEKAYNLVYRTNE